jgi:hypothetical protein
MTTLGCQLPPAGAFQSSRRLPRVGLTSLNVDRARPRAWSRRDGQSAWPAISRRQALPCGQPANHEALRKRPLPAWPGRAAVDSRHVTDFGHDHACFVLILATKIRDKSFHHHVVGVATCRGKRFRGGALGKLVATRGNGTATVGSRGLPVGLLPSFAWKGLSEIARCCSSRSASQPVGSWVRA